MHQITDQKFFTTLSRLHKEASSDKFKLLSSFPKFLLCKFEPKDASNAHLAISRDQGEFIFDLLIDTKAKNIVEYGTSFGISTIYLAAAAQITGGQVVTDAKRVWIWMRAIW
jgi:predicted O-methyltransferase YrrM